MLYTGEYFQWVVVYCFSDLMINENIIYRVPFDEWFRIMLNICKSVIRRPACSLTRGNQLSFRNPISRNFPARMNLVTISQSLDEAFTKHKIVPDVVDKFDTQGLLTIEYNPKDHVALGNTLKVSNTQNEPTIQFTLNSSGQEKELEVSEQDKFILVMTDPDAPSYTDKSFSEFAHWVITDLPLNANKDNSESAESLSTILDYSKGRVLVPYMGPGPPPKTKKHRYVFLLFKQDPEGKFEAPKERARWGTGVPGSGVRDWIKAHGPNSKLLGINFFYAQNEVQE